MKKIIIALLAVVAFAGTAFAAPAAPDEITFSKGGKKAPVVFNHKAHVAVAGDCTKCHATAAGGKIEGLKDFAHKTCKACHVEMKKGPTGCNDCHKK